MSNPAGSTRTRDTRINVARNEYRSKNQHRDDTGPLGNWLFLVGCWITICLASLFGFSNTARGCSAHAGLPREYHVNRYSTLKGLRNRGQSGDSVNEKARPALRRAGPVICESVVTYGDGRSRRVRRGRVGPWWMARGLLLIQFADRTRRR